MWDTALGEHWGAHMEGRPAMPPYLPAQVTEANVQLMLLAGLPLVSAAVFCTDKEAEEQSGGEGQETHTRVLSLRHWWEHRRRKLEGDFSDTNAIRGPVALKFSFPAPANGPTREVPMSPALAHTVLAHSTLWTLLWTLVSFIHACCLYADLCLDSVGNGSPSTAHKTGCRRDLPTSLTE